MKRIIILLLVVAMVAGVSFAQVISNKEVTSKLDNDGVRLLKGKADTSTWWGFNETKYLITWHSASCYDADSVAKCSLFIDLRFGKDTCIQTVAGTTTGAEYTVYKKLVVPDTMGATSFRIRVKADSRGDSMKVWSGWQAVPMFYNP